jgi:hypothetical protein
VNAAIANSGGTDDFSCSPISGLTTTFIGGPRVCFFECQPGHVLWVQASGVLVAGNVGCADAVAHCDGTPQCLATSNPTTYGALTGRCEIGGAVVVSGSCGQG